MSENRKSMPRKLSVTLILLAAPLFVVTLGTFFRHVQDLLHDEAMQRSNSILNTTMQRVVNFMTAIETAGMSNAWKLEENFNPDSLQAMSHRIVRLNPSLVSCSVSAEPDVFPHRGRYFSVYSVNEGDTILSILEQDFEYFERAWYQTALRGGEPCWVDPFSDFNEGSLNFADAVGSYCIPLRPHGDKIEGVLSVDFSFNRLSEKVLASEHPFPSAYYMLLGADGRYLIHSETNLLFKKTIFSGVDSLQHPDVIALGREMTAGKRGIKHVKMNGQNYHVCYAPVPGTHASLALVCLDKEILTDYNRLLYIAIVVVIVGLLLVLLITTRLVRHNIKPIERLLEATQKIADGNYDDEIPVSEGKDVVSQLQNNFAAMQQSLLEHRKSIEQTTEDIKRENEALEQAMQQVEESAKEKQLFIQNILRNICKPLNIIEGLSNMLLNGLSSRDKHAGALTGLSQSGPVDHQEIRNITNTMKHNAVQLNRMAHMLYDSSMTEEEGQTLYQRNDDVLCNEVVRESIDYTQANYPSAEMRLETELPDSMSIRSNRMYILRSMREILFNAAKYSDGKHITIRLTQTDDIVRFTVEDVGPGLPKDWQEVVSQPFLKVEEQSEGLGLGLPLTQRHMAGLGGEFIYDADYQKGCRVILELPKKENNGVGA